MPIEGRAVEGASPWRSRGEVAEEFATIDREIAKRYGRVVAERRLMETVIGGAQVETTYITIDFPEDTDTEEPTQSDATSSRKQISRETTEAFIESLPYESRH